MPRARPRRDPCDCADCMDRDRRVDPSLHSALARLEPPPKAAVVIIDGGLATDAAGSTSLSLARCSHLDAVARDGCAGLLAACAEEGSLSLAAQIFAGRRGNTFPLPARFKGAQAAMLANCPQIVDVGRKVGCQPVEALPQCPVVDWPRPQQVAEALLAALKTRPLKEYVGCFAPGAAIPDGEADMAVLVMQVPPATSPDAALDAACAAMEWADALVRRLDRAPGFKDTSILTLVATPTRGLSHPLPSTLTQERAALPPIAGVGAVVRPFQSFEYSGTERVAMDTEAPAVVVHRLAGVIRRDRVGQLSLEEAAARGGGGAIPAERMLAELAYKIDRAPKYGA